MKPDGPRSESMVEPVASKDDMAACLEATRWIDSDHPAVRDWARGVVGHAVSARDRAIALFYATRDQIRYDPYSANLLSDAFKASTTLERARAFCIPKAIVLAAGARVFGIPSRLAFADVRNHLASDRLLELLRTDLFVFHGYTELFIDGRWVKATPTFDMWLCRRFGVPPLEFDGYHDAVLQPFDAAGHRHMEYVADRGVFCDFPHELMLSAWREAYPHFFESRQGSGDDRGLPVGVDDLDDA